MKGKLTTTRKGQELEQEVDVLLIKQKYYFSKGDFVVMSKELSNLLKSKVANELTGLDFRVLFALISRADANNRIRPFKQRVLAEELGTSQQNISKTITKLTKMHIVEHDEFNMIFNKQFIYTGGNDFKKLAEQLTVEEALVEAMADKDGYTYGRPKIKKEIN